MLSNCPLLEELILRFCCDLTHIKISAPDLPLKSLVVLHCLDADEIEIFAPNLRSFRFYGEFIAMYFNNISSLVDAYVEGMCRADYDLDYDWMTVLRHLEHVKILTLCSGSLEYVGLVEEYTPEDLPVTFHNLQELQLVMEWSDHSYLACTCSFFKNCPCPCLEKLFIRLSAAKDPIDSDYLFEGLLAEDTSEIVFDHLKVIKMNGFTGLKDEMQLVKFFLEKAIALESLVLVAPHKGVCNVKEKSALECKSDHASLSKSIDTSLDLLCEQLLILTKASSSDVRILICEYSDDNGALLPTHTGDYCGSSLRVAVGV